MPDLGRRGFLKLLGSTALVLQASPTSFFDMGPSVALGAARGYNSFSSIDWIAREALKVLNRNLTFAKQIQRDYNRSWSAHAEQLQVEEGDVIYIGGKFQVNPAPASRPQLTFNHPSLIRIVDEQRPFFSDAAITEAAQSVADEIDRRGLELMHERLGLDAPKVRI